MYGDGDSNASRQGMSISGTCPPVPPHLSTPIAPCAFLLGRGERAARGGVLGLLGVVCPTRVCSKALPHRYSLPYVYLWILTLCVCVCVCAGVVTAKRVRSGKPGTRKPVKRVPKRRVNSLFTGGGRSNRLGAAVVKVAGDVRILSIAHGCSTCPTAMLQSGGNGGSDLL